MKSIKITLVLIILWSVAFGQAYTFETDKPDYSISKPHYEYVIAWREWDDASLYMYVDGSQPKSKWEYHLKGFESLEGLLKWLNSSNTYSYYNTKQKNVRLGEKAIVAIYDMTRAKKIKLKIHSEEMVEPYKVETKERKWTDFEWQLEE